MPVRRLIHDILYGRFAEMRGSAWEAVRERTLGAQEPARGDAPLTYAVCVGAQKAGTSWLFKYLDAHPQVHVPQAKEMHYFDTLFGPEQSVSPERLKRILRKYEAREASGRPGSEDEPRAPDQPMVYPSKPYVEALLGMYDDDTGRHERYFSLMTHGMGEERCVMDLTPAYAVIGKDGFKEILRVKPDAKIIFVMRDPVDRTWSALRMFWKLKQKHPDNTENLSLEETAKFFMKGRYRNIWRRSNYRHTVHAIDRVVPPKQRLYLFYEDLFTPATMRRLNNFLGVDLHPADFGTRVHKGAAAPMPPEISAGLRESLDPVYVAMRRRFGRRLPAAWDSWDVQPGAASQREEVGG